MDADTHEKFTADDLKHLEACLRVVVSTDPKVVPTIHANYVFQTARFILSQLSGYNTLIEARKLETSMVIARTILEAVFRLEAISNKPEILFRIAFDEFESDKKWMRSSSLSQTEKDAAVQEIENQWQGFKGEYCKQFPNHPVEEKCIKVVELADKTPTPFSGVYHAQYRLFSRFTHANLRAAAGGLDGFEESANTTVGCCVHMALRALDDNGFIVLENRD